MVEQMVGKPQQVGKVLEQVDNNPLSVKDHMEVELTL